MSCRVVGWFGLGLQGGCYFCGVSAIMCVSTDKYDMLCRHVMIETMFFGNDVWIGFDKDIDKL